MGNATHPLPLENTHGVYWPVRHLDMQNSPGPLTWGFSLMFVFNIYRRTVEHSLEENAHCILQWTILNGCDF